MTNTHTFSACPFVLALTSTVITPPATCGWCGSDAIMPALDSASNVGSLESDSTAALLMATVDPLYFTDTDTVAATFALVEKNAGDAVRAHSPMPLVASGEPHIALCDDGDDADGTFIVKVSTRPLVDT